MTTPISGPVTGYVPQTTTTTDKTTVKPGGELGKDAFLKLLVAQLKYQDPSKPADSSQFLAQTAQFTMVEKLEELATAQHDMLAAQRMATASSLVGHPVTYLTTDGQTATGVVTAAILSGSSPTVRVGNTDVPLSSVKEVQNSSTTS
jgi:flagellar basal-body rod modification protein FlgD